MPGLDLHDTIAAIATPLGAAGVGVIKISGTDAISIVDKIFRAKRRKRLSDSTTYTLHYGWIFEPSLRQKKGSFRRRAVIDEVIVGIMRAPYSYTREDVVEISCHSGVVPLRKILDTVLTCGARLARPGEFTERAFISGRIDLAQAEAVADIVSAKTDQALAVGIGQLSGGLSREVARLREKLLGILAEIEARIDFPQEEIAVATSRTMQGLVVQCQRDINKILATSSQGKILREGIKVVICGKPNVGKSSLLNLLLREERAIVTPIAGTTRDVIEEFVDIKGVPLRFVDTAGIIEPRDLIEREAINRSRRSLDQADLVLFVLDVSRKISADDTKIMELIKNKEVIAVLNKSDLPGKINALLLRKKFARIVRLSTFTRSGLSALEDSIIQVIWQGKVVRPQGILVSNARHIEALRMSADALARARQSLSQKFSWEFVALDVKLSVESLGEITGQSISDEVLGQIFNKFCIGK